LSQFVVFHLSRKSMEMFSGKLASIRSRGLNPFGFRLNCAVDSKLIPILFSSECEKCDLKEEKCCDIFGHEHLNSNEKQTHNKL